MNKGSKRSILIERSRTVWIKCYNKKGRIRIKKATISSINGDEITFKPKSARFAEITYTDKNIPYIGFTSFGRVFIAIVSNVLIITTLVAVVVVVAVLGAFFGWGSIVGNLLYLTTFLSPLRRISTSRRIHGGRCES